MPPEGLETHSVRLTQLAPCNGSFGPIAKRLASKCKQRARRAARLHSLLTCKMQVIAADYREGARDYPVVWRNKTAPAAS